MSGLGSSCSHIAALLFKLEAAVYFNLNSEDQTSCTSKLCSWKASRKQVAPAPLANINFSRPKKQSLPKPKKSFPMISYSCMDPTKGNSAICMEQFSNLYSTNPEIALFTSLDCNYFTKKDGQHCVIIEYEGESDEDNLPEPLTSLYDPACGNMPKVDLDRHCNQLYKNYCSKYDEKDYDNLFDITRKQNLSDIWKIHRAGRVTASLCYQISKMQHSPSLINTILQYTSFTSKYTEYGKSMENKAKQCFISAQSHLHSNFVVHEAGLRVSAKHPCLGATPDGIVSCTCHGSAVLEIKCPYTYKNGLKGWREDVNFPLDKDLQMKTTHKFYYQVQMQMALCKVEFCYFVVFSPVNNDFLLSIVNKNDSFIKNLTQTLILKFTDCILCVL